MLDDAVFSVVSKVVLLMPVLVLLRVLLMLNAAVEDAYSSFWPERAEGHAPPRDTRPKLVGALVLLALVLEAQEVEKADELDDDANVANKAVTAT